MFDLEKYFKRSYCYLTWLIYLIFSGFVIAMSSLCDWPVWVTPFEVVMCVLMTVVTFHKKITRNLHSYIFMLISNITVFVCSYAQHNMDNIILVICGLIIICAIYRNTRMMILQFFLNVIVMLLHCFVFETISFETTEDVVQAVINVLILIFSEIGMIIFTEYLNGVERNLTVSLNSARQAEHSKSDFLANMSHEIRTPMNAIVGMCEIMLREDINDEVRENCVNIQNSGRSLLAIINDILDFSKIESGKADLIENEFNIGSTINDVINMAVTRKGEKNIEIIARIDPNIPKGLVGDEIRIKQVMVNLITNAVKFTNRGCVVLKITQSRHSYGTNLSVSVSDTGIGISGENLEKLFTSFQQVDTRKNRTVEGTGLGLAISKRLITKMGGFINVSSVYGEGSTFKFVIPIKISDDRPFISLKENKKINTAVYIDMEKFGHERISEEYYALIDDVSKYFDLNFTVCKSQKELESYTESGEFTHCIIAKEEYLNAVNYYNDAAEKGKFDVVVIQDRIDAIHLPKKIKCIYKPFYIMSLVSVYNNERFIFGTADKKNAHLHFTAPEARVLIVDDNVINLKVASGLMKPYNMKVSTAISGYEAIEMLESKIYDIVFMDHMMPDMDGVEATHIIRKMEGEYYKRLPIVALTANAINGAREMFLNEGFDDFIAKPIETSILDRTLRHWLPKEKIVSSMLVDIEEVEEKEEEVKSVTFNEHINFATGLMYAGDNREIYIDNLSTYFSTGADYKASLEKRFEEEDWEKYTIEAHALKSSSLSIGAEVLSERAKALEFAGKGNDIELIKEKHSEMIEMYGVVLDEIRNYLVENGYDTCENSEIDEESLNEITIEELENYVERICTACDDFDGDAVEAIIEELSEFKIGDKILAECFAEVKKAAGDFDYDSAAEKARNVISEIKEV